MRHEIGRVSCLLSLVYRLPVKGVAAVGLILLIAASCGSGSSDSTSTVPATTSLAPPSTAPFTPGAPGAGDAYYPGLGNGGYDVQHYDLELTYDADGSVEADVVITAAATQNLSGFNLDFVGWEIDDLAVDGNDASYARDGDELVVAHAIPSGDRFEIEISYHGTPEPIQSAALPLRIGWLTGPQGEQFVVAEPDAAHSWFPANDHPTDKATYSFTITVPTGFLAAANGEVTEVVEDETTTTYRWSMDAPMASYLATVVIGEGWEIVHDAVATETAGLPIRNVLPSDLVGDAPAALEQTGEMINILEEAFGPYPFDRYGIAVVDGFPHALENQTLSVFGRTMVDTPFFAFVHVHELAHQWFGNSVSVAQWSDIWLNEGFATFAELLWVEHLFGAGAYQEEVANRTEAARIAAYGAPASPLPNDLFNGSVYQRGALVLVALRDEIGDNAFFATLRTYAERYANGNATTEGFIAAAEETSGHDLTDLFATWLYGQELPS
jgi:aminopeptidase N